MSPGLGRRIDDKLSVRGNIEPPTPIQPAAQSTRSFVQQLCAALRERDPHRVLGDLTKDRRVPPRGMARQSGLAL